MAYRTPPTPLSCPICGFVGHVVIVIGKGPSTRKGDVPYRQFREEGPFIKAETEDGLAQLTCPEDGTVVWTNERAAIAYGPLTEQEMRGITGQRWLVPGTETPFPPEPRPYNPDDPFTLKPAPRR
ncbi:hypothetical protein EI983_02855 [Roseovarius faecimaris]|uniref:Uncharacterized protein n=1 Tax=Roseovarius faecimaris TaxID=2494550 RepID=A0A6I6IJX3_9RHOB|nr:hypothetical protein [Roseovarius faecimaris]QGX97270.1 hypothetical protein EI983_02855 [Roseovarius faecimaris]